MADFEVPPLEHTPWPTPSRAIYGFVLYVITYVGFGFYLLWALLPDVMLKKIGLTYLPARHWVITFPLLFCFGLLLVLSTYIFRNWMDSPGEKDTGESNLNNLKDLDVPVDDSKLHRE